MPLLLSEVYDALREAGASEDKARSAATAVADDHNRLISIEAKLDKVEALYTQGRLEMRILLGIIMALSAGILWAVA